MLNKISSFVVFVFFFLPFWAFNCLNAMIVNQKGPTFGLCSVYITSHIHVCSKCALTYSKQNKKILITTKYMF